MCEATPTFSVRHLMPRTSAAKLEPDRVSPPTGGSRQEPPTRPGPARLLGAEVAPGLVQPNHTCIGRARRVPPTGPRAARTSPHAYLREPAPGAWLAGSASTAAPHFTRLRAPPPAPSGARRAPRPRPPGHAPKRQARPPPTNSAVSATGPAQNQGRGFCSLSSAPAL